MNTTSIYEQARAVYDREPCARSFEEDLWHHFQHGYVVCTPTAFAMVRIVRSDWPMEWLREPWRIDADGDCWWIWLLSGDVAETVSWLPFPKKHIAFERGNQSRVLCYEKFTRRLQRRAVHLCA